MSVRIWLHEQRDAETERMALRSRMLLEQRGHAVAGEDADAVIGNRSSYTELIGSQSRQLVLHARFLVERRQLYSEIGIERKNKLMAGRRRLYDPTGPLQIPDFAA